VIPKGCHVRLDVQTGERTAKIATDDDSKIIDNHSPGTGVIIGQDQKPSNKTPNVNTPNIPSKSRLTLTEKHGFGKLIEGMIEKSDKEIIEILDKLEEYVHDIDYGVLLLEANDGIATMTRLLSHENQVIRTKVALVLGSCAQVNLLFILNTFFCRITRKPNRYYYPPTFNPFSTSV
jgi:hypothetical protein